ncbi:unannotated protein [freshwater metagenome]|uniref:Unannotated protein n=1 Tax=freshwater metagenome TaxID=449393 RepID=A0A6J7LZ23_9ZZZZ
MQATADSVGEWPCHEGGVNTATARNLVDELAKEKRSVGCSAGRLVVQRCLDLARGELRIHALDLKAREFGELGDGLEGAGRVSPVPDAVDTMVWDRELDEGSARGEEEELHLESRHRGEAPRRPAAADELKLATGVERQGLAIRPVERGHRGATPARPWAQRVEIDASLHVGESRARRVGGHVEELEVEALDHHGDRVVGRVVEAVGRHGLAVGEPEQVGEDDVDLVGHVRSPLRRPRQPADPRQRPDECRGRHCNCASGYRNGRR